MKRWLPTATLLAVLVYLALRPPAGESEALRRDFPALGTWVSISIHPESDAQRGAAEQALATLEQRFHAFEQRWAITGDGAVAQINRKLAEGAVAEIPQPLVAGFEQAAQMRRLSGGLFDARIGALVKLWGFDDASNYRSAPPPDKERQALLQALQQAPAWRLGSAYGPATMVQWDFGAIAKGQLVDESLEFLRDAGLTHALVNAGGNLKASGRHGARNWRIAIRHPRPTDQRRLLATLEPQDEAVITSGDYERYFEFQDRRYHHILDPRSGQPAQGLQSVTVVAASAALADAASTALFVAGAQGWRELARRMALDTVLVVDGAGQIWATPRAAERLQLAGEQQAQILP